MCSNQDGAQCCLSICAVDATPYPLLARLLLGCTAPATVSQKAPEEITAAQESPMALYRRMAAWI